MNGTQYVPIDVEPGNYDADTATSATEDAYATAPVPAVRPAYQFVNEEELHTSFEEAISDRLVALHSKLSRISDPLLSTQQVQCDTASVKHTWHFQQQVQGGPVVSDGKEQQSQATRSSLFGNAWQRCIILGGCALMCMLAGFDLMGLLVLQVR